MRLDKERRIKREIRNNRSISTGAVPIREAAVVVFLVVWGAATNIVQLLIAEPSSIRQCNK